MSRIRKTFIAIFFGRGLMAIRQLLLVPILIKAWGVDYYGSWLILSSIPSFITMSNLGLGNSASTQIATRSSAESEEENSVTLITAWAMILSVIFLICLILLLWNQFSRTSFSTIPNGFTILLALVLNAFVRMLGQPLHGWWVAQGFTSRGLQWHNIYAIGDLVVYLAIPLLGGFAFSLTLSSLTWCVIWLILYIIATYRAGCRLFKLKSPEFNEAKSLLKTGIGHQLNPLWQGFLFQGSIMLAGHLFGSSGAAMWGALRVINRAGNQLLELVSQTVGPEFQRNFSKNNLVANQILHTKAVLTSIILSSGVCVGLIIFGPWMFSKWTHHAFTEPKYIWLIMPLSLIPFSMWCISGEYQRSINRPWHINFSGIIAAVLSLVVSWVMQSFGVISLAIGAMAFELYMSATVGRKTLNMLDQSTQDFAINIISLTHNLFKIGLHKAGLTKQAH